MKAKILRLSIWVFGIALLAGSLVGANLALKSRAGDGKAREAGDANAKEESKTAVAPARGDGAVCIAYIDVEERVRPLYATHPGKVLEVPVREGQSVKKGAVLFRMEDQPAQFLVRTAEADLRVAEARLKDAVKLPKKHRLEVAQQRQALLAKQHALSAERHGLDRLQRLFRNNQAPQDEVSIAEDKVKTAEALVAVEEQNLSKLDLVDPENDIARAEADVAAKRAQLDSARFGLNECTVKAPDDGIVLRLSAGVGETLSSMTKEPAIQFLPEGPRIVRAEVEQEFANRVEVGQSAEVQDDSKAGPTWHGKVVRMSDWYTHRRSILQEPLQFNDVRTLECIIQLDPHPQTPRIGQRVRVMLGSLAAQK